MKFIFIIALLLLSSLLIFTGCQSASNTPAITGTSPAAAALTVTDDVGREVVFNTAPQRIISLAPSNTEIIYALGLEDRLIGVTTYCNYPEAARSKPQVSEYSEVDIEKIVELHPDLVLADNIHIARVVPALEELGIPVLVLNPGTIDQILGDIRLVGNLTGQTQNTEALVRSLTQRLQKVTDQISTLKSDKPRVLYVTWHDPIWTAGDNTIIGDLFRRLGASNIAGDLDGYATLTLEQVVERNPQVILVMSSMGDRNTSLDYINSEPRLQATDALNNQRVYSIEADIFGRTTPRIVDGLETLAKLIYPESVLGN